jgi:hypothetical protein
MTIAVVGVILGFAAGMVTSAMTIWLRRQDRRSKLGRSSCGVSLSIGSLLDPTGGATYTLLRRILAVGEPERSAAQPFRASAQTISRAYTEALSDHQHIGTGNGSL